MMMSLPPNFFSGRSVGQTQMTVNQCPNEKSRKKIHQAPRTATVSPSWPTKTDRRSSLLHRALVFFFNQKENDRNPPWLTS
jgi:hypothetical protein